jgi:beta-fructofuranosidase
MFDLDGFWVWDFWLADDGTTYHLFFLYAPRSLPDPDQRHDHARIGHAAGKDLHRWTRLRDPVPEPRQGFDDLAQWTGCTVHDGEQWWLFTTGRTAADEGRVQRIGSARSRDLVTWERTGLVLEADPRWYDVGQAVVHWRDPWVVRDAAGTWHLYATARAGGPGSGVVGHATSEDLRTWDVRPPLSEANGRFEWLEVIQVVEVEGRWVALFNCLSAEMPGAPAGVGGIWTVPVVGPGAPVDVAAAERLTDEASYVGKVAVDRGGRWQLLAFRNLDAGGRFVGGVADPVPIAWRVDGRGLEMRSSGGVGDSLL